MRSKLPNVGEFVWQSRSTCGQMLTENLSSLFNIGNFSKLMLSEMVAIVSCQLEFECRAAQKCANLVDLKQMLQNEYLLAKSKIGYNRELALRSYNILNIFSTTDFEAHL